MKQLVNILTLFLFPFERYCMYRLIKTTRKIEHTRK